MPNFFKKNIAIVLCGSGFKDGSEIRESVATLWALSHHPHVRVQCFAPDAPQFDVVNGLTGETVKNESRNMLVESARIARGDVKPLSQLLVEEFQAIILPGGYGAAKNLCSFAQNGIDGKVIPDLQNILETFHQERKPIGAICISPAILALAFQGKGFEMTLGPESEASEAINKLGHKHRVCSAGEFYFDARNRIVTTPAYMIDQAPLYEIFKGIQGLVNQVIEITT